MSRRLVRSVSTVPSGRAVVPTRGASTTHDTTYGTSDGSGTGSGSGGRSSGVSRIDDVATGLFRIWLVTGWPVASVAGVVWFLRTFPVHDPHAVPLPVAAAAACGIVLAAMVAPVAARLLLGLALQQATRQGDRANQSGRGRVTVPAGPAVHVEVLGAFVTPSGVVRRVVLVRELPLPAPSQGAGQPLMTVPQTARGALAALSAGPVQYDGTASRAR